MDIRMGDAGQIRVYWAHCGAGGVSIVYHSQLDIQENGTS